MRRKRKQRRSSAAPSMFPFLAVLICTMGALISLLVMGVRQAQVHADEIVEDSQQRSSQQLADVQRQQHELENYQWRSEVLNAQREDHQQQISSNRLALSHLEHHTRELQQQLEALKVRRERLKNQHADSKLNEDELNDQIRQWQEKLETARSELEQKREAVTNQSQSYAIIPYAGEQGTHRRPIYIECVAEGILIQPEQILITEAEMAGPPGPGNPLDACLRTIREFYAEHTGDHQVSPYPLLIVRASGVRSYGVARQAMTDWQDEFGYELIDDDLKLAFPRPQPALARTLHQTIREARSRQQALAATMPRRYRPNGSDSRSYPHSGTSVLPTQSNHPSNGVSPEDIRAEGQSSSELAHSSVEKPHNETQQDGNGSRYSEGSADSQVGMPGRAVGWGLHKESSLGPAITRPVRVLCNGKQLIIMPAAGERGPDVPVPVTGKLQDSIDSFVQALHQYTKQWGIALAGGYWKPELHVIVSPGGEEHYYQLRQYLRRSGIDVTQRIESAP